MGSVDRADYMDNIKVAEIEQTIAKERAIQRAFFSEQEKLGKLQLKPPTPPPAKQSLKEKYGVPSHLPALLNDPETSMELNISRQLWGNAVPGYIVRDGLRTLSTAKQDYQWDEDEIEFMKQQGMLDKTHNRRRDEHTKYIEARALLGKTLR